MNNAEPDQRKCRYCDMTRLLLAMVIVAVASTMIGIDLLSSI